MSMQSPFKPSANPTNIAFGGLGAETASGGRGGEIEGGHVAAGSITVQDSASGPRTIKGWLRTKKNSEGETQMFFTPFQGQGMAKKEIPLSSISNKLEASWSSMKFARQFDANEGGGIDKNRPYNVDLKEESTKEKAKNAMNRTGFDGYVGPTATPSVITTKGAATGEGQDVYPTDSVGPGWTGRVWFAGQLDPVDYLNPDITGGKKYCKVHLRTGAVSFVDTVTVDRTLEYFDIQGGTQGDIRVSLD